MLQTFEQICRRVQRWWPKNVETLLKSCQFPLRFIGDGAFRDVYEIVGTGYVVKVPQSPDGYEHAKCEYLAWKRVGRKASYAALKKYMPVQMYFNRRSGCVVMPLYDDAVDNKYDREMEHVAQLVDDITGCGDNDVSSDKWDNWGLDRDGNLIMIDLGCLERGW